MGVALVSGVAVWLQMVLVLWGPQDARFDLCTMQWPEDEARVEGVKRLVLDTDDETDTADDEPMTGTSSR